MSQAASSQHLSGRPPRRDAPCYAALDLGTNNCRLLIATPAGRGFRIVEAFSRIVRLGQGLSQTGRLDDAAMARTLAALKVCSDKIARRGASTVRAVATQACRQADNGEAFIAEIQARTGLALQIITPARGGPAVGGRLSQPDRPQRRGGAGGGRGRGLNRAVVGGPARRGAPPPGRPPRAGAPADPRLAVGARGRRHPGGAFPGDDACI